MVLDSIIKVATLSRGPIITGHQVAASSQSLKNVLALYGYRFNNSTEFSEKNNFDLTRLVK